MIFVVCSRRYEYLIRLLGGSSVNIDFDVSVFMVPRTRQRNGIGRYPGIHGVYISTAIYFNSNGRYVILASESPARRRRKLRKLPSFPYSIFGIMARTCFFMPNCLFVFHTEINMARGT